MSSDTSTTSEAEFASPSKAGVAIRLLTCVMAFFLVAFGVCTFFTLNTFEKVYVGLAADRYVVASEHLRDDLQAYLCGSSTVEELRECNAMRARGGSDSLRARIRRFQTEILAIESEYAGPRPAVDDAEPRVSVSVASATNGTIYYSTQKRRIGRKLPNSSKYVELSDVIAHDEAGGRFVASVPLYDVDRRELAVVSISLDESLLTSITDFLLARHQRALLLVLGACILALLVGTLWSMPEELRIETLPKRKITVGMILLVCLSQVGASWTGAEILQRNRADVGGQKTADLATWVKQEIEERLGYDSTLAEAASALLSSRTSGIGASETDEASQAYSVRSVDGEEIARFVHTRREFVPLVGASTAPGPAASDPNAVVVPIERGGRVIGQLVTWSKMPRLGREMIGVVVDVLIAVVISILCLVELLILSFKYLETLFHKRDSNGNLAVVGKGAVHYSVMRPAIFLFLFGVDFSAVLIPLQMESLYEPLLGLPRDFVIALPVTAMFFSVGITFLIAGAWMDRRGWNEPFITGVVVTGACKLYAWLAPDAIHFIVAMSGVGFGYGLALMAAQGFVMANTSDKEKAHGIAYFFAGVYAGNIGGLAIGAMVAEHIAYEHIFLIGSMFIFASLAFSLKFLRPAFESPESMELSQSGTEFTASTFRRFILDRNVLSLVLFCSVPAAVAMIGFLHYFSPIYLNRLGVSESLIGGVLMLYGISLVYISPLVSRLIDATDRKDLFIATGCALGALGFMSFGILEGLAATLTAVLFLGLSGSCLQSAQTAYTLKLKATRALGPGKGVAFVRATSRVGQMLGPIVFSWFVMASNTEEAVTNFGLVYLAIALMFILFSKRERPEIPQPKPETDEMTPEPASS